ncbi:MAG: hypothetical protein LBK41_01115 [Clostridiales bacterium]|jgi:hypothetical protein|nr:hypothetical protein [Clostridiales bacterium]
MSRKQDLTLVADITAAALFALFTRALAEWLRWEPTLGFVIACLAGWSAPLSLDWVLAVVLKRREGNFDKGEGG